MLRYRPQALISINREAKQTLDRANYDLVGPYALFWRITISALVLDNSPSAYETITYK